MTKRQSFPEGLPVTAEVEDAGRTGSRPNILVICTDQLRADFLGINGHPIVQTPVLDQIALSGINFRHAFSEVPVCCPARRVLMTGRDPFGVHMLQNRDLQPFPEGPKLAELLTGAGYQTCGIGKFHVWPPRNRIGFEEAEVNEEGRTAGHVYPDDYQQFLLDHGLGPQAHAHGLGNNQVGYRPSPVPEWATTTGWTADRAMRFLRRRDPERPFFLYVSFDKPHPPMTPPAEYYDLYRNQRFPDPAVGDWVDEKPHPRRERMHRAHNWPQWSGREAVIQETLRGYAGCISHIDSRVGQVLGTLRETGLAANTWILFLADHGDACFDHHLLAKGDFFAGSCNVPFFLAPPDRAVGTFRPDRIGHTDRSTPVGLQDVLPTLCEIAGAEIPKDIPGRSLLPFFREEEPAWREALCGVIATQYAATDGTWKLCWDGETGHEFLFNLREDPKDEHDLAGQPELETVRRRLRTELHRWLAAHDDPHVEGEQLVPVPLDRPDAQPGYRASHWNHRGWRG